MKKYTMEIDGDRYVAIFHTSDEVIAFINSNLQDNASVTIISITDISIKELLQCKEFEYSYIVEMIAISIMPDTQRLQYHKWTELEKELKELGYL